MSEQNTPVQDQEAPPSLTLSDLTLALQTIQVVVQRGAIKAEEMSTVGGLYDRLFTFLKSQGAVGQEAPAEEPTQGI